MSRLSLPRFFRLIELLHGPNCTVRRLARELRVSEKTLYRDVDALRDLGVPLFYNERCHCWYLGVATSVPAWFRILQRTFTR